MDQSIEELDIRISEYEYKNLCIFAQYKEYTREEDRVVLRSKIEENEWCISAIRNIIDMKLSGQ